MLSSLYGQIYIYTPCVVAEGPRVPLSSNHFLFTGLFSQEELVLARRLLSFLCGPACGLCCPPSPPGLARLSLLSLQVLVLLREEQAADVAEGGHTGGHSQDGHLRFPRPRYRIVELLKLPFFCPIASSLFPTVLVFVK